MIPLLSRRRFAGKRSWLTLLKVSLAIVLVFYIALPLVYHFFPTVPRHLVFLPFLRWPRGVSFTQPELSGLAAARNFYVTTTDGVRLGVWHILPGRYASSVSADITDPAVFESQLSSGVPIIFYNHGNSGSRAGPHRVELYKVLRRIGYHVVCFDYRGYADSSPVPPSETGVVADSRFMYSWLRQRAGRSPIIVWGHSLGTGVTSHMVADLCREGDPPTALVLESPFNNIQEEVSNHKLASIYRKMPGFRWLILDPLIAHDMAFESDRHIANVTVPILIMHAEDDLIIPYELAVKLHRAALHHHPADRITFETFEARYHYGHKYICRSPRLPDIVRDFVNKSILWHNQ
ncbi:lysophosphatidylserine lipase ABHD12-like [Pollicipes pollicipes]|uniref:lysophosphatidylserine lipase ABHD12-like n=1 Tax=Pollicipes pollicipes TaxID=41117 RepID=UPI00188490B7|nr:lysophosphatidylserine lipase ABHD12-like [Pollicipes pollicipes]XP_037083204.1 lysophosphatidylserine lipase ABHD12-like [Pollicipes pollicipes]